jgi:serine/threonine-protein kinase
MSSESSGTVAVDQNGPENPFNKRDFSGMELGDFRLLRRIGEGGMGQVYLAEQRSLQRRVALKIVRPEFSTDATWSLRFKNEAKAIAQLTHPNIVQVYAVGMHAGLEFMALEYVEGMNLKDYLVRKGPPDLPIALAIMRQIADALTKASELGIIHRDIKPENVLVTRRVDVKVTDFGLSRMVGEDLHLTKTGTAIGTPLYMSPEQIMGQPLDPRTDLYSFGATCYHLLTGQPPFVADNALTLGIKHIADPPKGLATFNPTLPPELCNLVERLLAKQPDQRPQSAREVLREIRRLQAKFNGSPWSEAEAGLQHDEESDTLAMGGQGSNGEVTTSSPISSTLVERPSRKRWLWPVLGVSLGLAIIGGSLIGRSLRGESNVHPAPSRPVSPTPVEPNPTAPKNAHNAAFEEMEKTLVKRVDDTRVPRDPQKLLDFPEQRLLQGLRARAELMHLYVLDAGEEMVAKARQFAEREINSPVETYKAIGYIGKAGILANEGKYKESYEALERGYQILHNASRKRPATNQFLKMKDTQDIIAVTLRLNQKQAPLPASLKEIMQEERNQPANPK